MLVPIRYGKTVLGTRKVSVWLIVMVVLGVTIQETGVGNVQWLPRWVRMPVSKVSLTLEQFQQVPQLRRVTYLRQLADTIKTGFMPKLDRINRVLQCSHGYVIGFLNLCLYIIRS